MNRLIFILPIVAVVFMQCAYGTPPQVHGVRDDDDDDGTYEIISGNCSIALAADIIFTDHVHKLLIPFVQRNATSSWHGDQKIYCLEVLNEDSDNSTRGTAFVKEGGVGHTFVTIEMHSKTSHGMEFDIMVYGK
ncbi:hypothetical protein NQ318_008644 [Aromia moschata]|uniref:Uncharacterized protein n=1 Tax=Aromia moschata TaxID=1265417 RepID=A0AAV8YUQ6_9CUCU|nr:hypothetical protein NQ318_008644 [Aromia moschata]